MTFDTPTLKFQSLQFKNNKEKLHIGENSIKLKPTSVPGQYDIGENDILVKLDAAALNPIDIILYNTSSPWLSRLVGTKIKGFGRDYSGTIVSIGAVASKKTDFKVDDQVCGMYDRILGAGTVSEYLVVNPFKDKAITLKPANLNSEEAAAWPLVYGTAVSVLNARSSKNNLNENSQVIVLGAATSVGRHAVALLKNVYHVQNIVGVCSSKSADTVTRLGASTIIDYTKYPTNKGGVYPPVKAYVESHGGKKFDMVLDCCGNSDLLRNKIEQVINRTGDYVTISGDYKYDYATVNWFGNAFANYRIAGRIIGSRLGLLPYRYSLVIVPSGGWIEDGQKAIEKGNTEVAIDSVYSFHDFEKALDRLKSNRAQGKIVIRINEK